MMKKQYPHKLQEQRSCENKNIESTPRREVKKQNNEMEPVKFSLAPVAAEMDQVTSKELTVAVNENIPRLKPLYRAHLRSEVSIYYISDLHLEFQIQPIWHDGITQREITEFFDERIRNMIQDADSKHGYLLVAGDVAHSLELTQLFYGRLRKQWSGPVIGVLGNHELWDGHPEGNLDQFGNRSLEDIISDYCNKEAYREQGLRPPLMLQNSVMTRYKNLYNKLIPENALLTVSEEKLTQEFADSSMIILGGLGFTGRNPYYNAELGLYRGAVQTLVEDQALSERFRRIYDKVRRCAENKRVIVLTHTPVRDWSPDPYNPCWIYINGHTHQNTVLRKEDGTTVLSDNQIGYTPCEWGLSEVTTSRWYDPLESLDNGVHQITHEAYNSFYSGREIYGMSCNHEGQIYVLKRNGIYLFLLQTPSALYFLEGGRKHRLKQKTISYYYDNMLSYYEVITSGIKPYQDAIERLAYEVRKFGGEGSVHGCIVDITWYSHLYLDPMNGTIMACWRPEDPATQRPES